MMDRKLLTASPFPEMEHQFPTERIFPSAVHSLNRTHLMVFDNCTKKVSKQNEKKKKLSGKTWHIPEQPNLELISRERLHGPGDCTSSCQLGMFSVANGLVGHSKNPSSAEEKLIFSRGSQSFLKGPRRAPGSEFFKAQMYQKHT